MIIYKITVRSRNKEFLEQVLYFDYIPTKKQATTAFRYRQLDIKAGFEYWSGEKYPVDYVDRDKRVLGAIKKLGIPSNTISRTTVTDQKVDVEVWKIEVQQKGVHHGKSVNSSTRNPA